MKKLPNIHPREILQEEFLIPLSITPYRLAKETKIPQTRISEIIKGNRRITADTALRLSKYFGNSAKFWPGLQDDFDIETELDEKREELNHIKRFAAARSINRQRVLPVIPKVSYQNMILVHLIKHRTIFMNNAFS
jgi:addiction module HigA family antidote